MPKIMKSNVYLTDLEGLPEGKGVGGVMLLKRGDRVPDWALPLMARSCWEDSSAPVDEADMTFEERLAVASVSDVQALVGDDLERAKVALDWELAHKKRSSVCAWLAGMIEYAVAETVEVDEVQPDPDEIVL